MTRVAIETLGCKLNQAESESLIQQLKQAGCRIVDFHSEADIYVIHTCTVTHVADRKSRHFIRLAKRHNPRAKVIAIGCYAGNLVERNESFSPDLILDNERKGDLMSLLRLKDWIKPDPTAVDKKVFNRTRSFIKAQDGCNSRCAYCIVPLVRGQERSLPPEDIIAAIRNRLVDGHQEVVLTGTEIGRYNFNGTDIVRLLKKILAETTVPRLRLSSLQPAEITSELVDLWQNTRLCRHFHISLQSGSDTVLKRMNRRYNCEQFAEKITYLRVLIPEVSITTDVIVGFPGETEDEFHDSYEFCRRMKFARTHVFSFSARPGTAAEGMPKQIPSGIKKARSQKMYELGLTSLLRFNNAFLETEQLVLFEQLDSGFWTGYTDNYLKVYTKNTENLTNCLKKVKLLNIKGQGIEGHLA